MPSDIGILDQRQTDETTLLSSAFNLLGLKISEGHYKNHRANLEKILEHTNTANIITKIKTQGRGQIGHRTI